MSKTLGTRKIFDLLRTLPKVSLNNMKPIEGMKKKKQKRFRGGVVHTNHRVNVIPVGYEGGNIPFHMRFKVQTWHKDHELKLSYIPLTLKKLQFLIDLGRVRTDIPIDVAQISYSGILDPVSPMEREGGYILQDEGLDLFQAEINLEVQWATEPIIAAIERTGSIITTAYYDPFSLDALRDPIAFFKRGTPIVKRRLPPQNLIEYYSDPKNRGYLADPDAIAEERFVLAQKYGYTLPDIRKSPKYEMLRERKDPRQIFYGLNPGWIVNMTDKQILKPKSPELQEYYSK